MSSSWKASAFKRWPFRALFLHHTCAQRELRLKKKSWILYEAHHTICVGLNFLPQPSHLWRADLSALLYLPTEAHADWVLHQSVLGTSCCLQLLKKHVLLPHFPADNFEMTVLSHSFGGKWDSFQLRRTPCVHLQGVVMNFYLVCLHQPSRVSTLLGNKPSRLALSLQGLARGPVFSMCFSFFWGDMNFVLFVHSKVWWVSVWDPLFHPSRRVRITGDVLRGRGEGKEGWLIVRTCCGSSLAHS